RRPPSRAGLLSLIPQSWQSWGLASPHDDVWKRVGERLGTGAPAQQRVSLTHGDYKLANVLTQGSEITAVLDWELCVLGDPLVDLAGLLVDWRGPVDPEICTPSPTRVGGFLSRGELLRRYEAATGLSTDDLDYYLTLAFWRGATLLRGVLERRRAGVMGSHGALDPDFIEWSVGHMLKEADDLSEGAGARAALPGIDLVDTDEYPHPPGPESNFSESIYYQFADPRAEVTGFVRLANRANEGVGERTICLFLPDGKVAFDFSRKGFPDPGKYSASGMSFTIRKPFEAQSACYSGTVSLLGDPLQLEDPKRALSEAPKVKCELNIDFAAMSPVDEGSPAGGSFAAHHYEQFTSSTAQLVLGSQRFNLSGHGIRDHSWGPRSWASPWYYRWLHGCGAEFAFMVGELGFRDGSTVHNGFVWQDGRFHVITHARIETDWTTPRHMPRGIHVTAHAATGTWNLDGQVRCVVPLRHRKTGGEDVTVTRIAEAQVSWTLSSRPDLTISGIAEYLDQVIDGLPVGMRA
ncbi:phosphotransferase, partial [Streptomyces hirsutus]|uniref:phosphotransferase n=1 Tax=Streptomyces hirsutus TaxID=35620 RepID=UPI0034161F5F